MSPTSFVAAAQLLMPIVDLAIQGVPRAIAAVSTVRRLVAERRDPTAAEWAELQEVTDALHARVQAAAREDDGA